jgi:hypothetical protein
MREDQSVAHARHRRQIAEALEAAHEKGIVHRDLKPANVKITPAGVVKVLDFGLAKGGNGAASDVLSSSFATVGTTREGSVLGTAAYMSPEQARGDEVDKRADIWAFGCVLYEECSPDAGRSAAGRLADTLAGILEREPSWDALPNTVPSRVRALLRRCLQKDPARRLRDIADARFELEDDDEPESPNDKDVRPSTRALRSLAVMAAVAAIGIGACVHASGPCISQVYRSSAATGRRQLVERHPRDPVRALARWPATRVCRDRHRWAPSTLGAIARRAHGAAACRHRRCRHAVLVCGQPDDRFQCGRQAQEDRPIGRATDRVGRRHAEQQCCVEPG